LGWADTRQEESGNPRWHWLSAESQIESPRVLRLRESARSNTQALEPAATGADYDVDGIGVMKLASFEAVVTALEGAGVRYLVADGLAVNAHG
jgi:hypothetical protein